MSLSYTFQLLLLQCKYCKLLNELLIVLALAPTIEKILINDTLCTSTMYDTMPLSYTFQLVPLQCITNDFFDSIICLMDF